MTHAIDSIHAAPGPPARGRLHVPAWVVHRERLARRLDRGTAGRVTLVSGPSGWGKTLGVTSWASRTRDPDGLLWLSTAGAAADPELFLELLRDQVVERGVHCPPLAGPRSHERARTRLLATLGRSLRHSGPWVLVLDDYPTGEVGTLGADLEILVHHAHRGLSLVVVSHGEPALAVQRHHVAGELTRIGLPDLAMDRYEVATVLARHEVEAGELTARTVERHTGGWACGVRLAAHALRDAPTLEAAMAQADRATVDFLAAEVLGRAPAHVRELLVRTSVVADVSPDLARAVMGPDADVTLTPSLASEVSLELRADRSFRCPPLLRAAALAELAGGPPAVSREATQRAAQWHLDHGRVTAGLEIAMTAGDWPWLGRALVGSYVVPQILAGEATATVESALATDAVRDGEPLLEAVLALRREGPDAAETELSAVTDPGPDGGATPADELSEVFVRLAVARARGDVDSGLCLAIRARELVPTLPRERQRPLLTILHAHEGALALTAGDLPRAEATLRHGAGQALDEGRSSAATMDCLAQLALLDAYRDNLRAAERQAALVLKGVTQERRAGAAHAHLATAWVHIERAEHVPARQHLDRASAEVGGGAEPWFHTALLLAEVRLLVQTGQPEAALRLLGPALEAVRQRDGAGWRVALLTVAAAQALLATGEPRRALELVVPGPDATWLTNRVLAARALMDLGDLVGARTALAAMSPELPGVPLGVQVEGWVLEARLSQEAEAADRSRLLVDRALRVAGRELLRRPFVHESSWLLPLVEQDPTLRRAHGGFLARLGTHTAGPTARGTAAEGPAVRGSAPPWSGQLLVETLTVREAQVLGLLAEMYSTEEIARELFLSVNTVKTYVRGILRKLSVNRRVDAVRRGRELGLC